MDSYDGEVLRLDPVQRKRLERAPNGDGGDCDTIHDGD